MLQSSILDRLSGPLCDAVLEQQGSAELLAALARANLFLMPLDDRGEWYRFHHLFAQLLRVELEHRHPGLTPTLHRRAFEWHRDHGSVDEAIEHALQAGLFAEAGGLIAAAWVDYANVGRHATVLAWLERFPPATLSEDARLQLVAAWVLSLCGRREAAAEAIAAVERLGNLGAGPLPDGFSSLEASLATLRASIPWGDFGRGIEYGRTCGRARSTRVGVATRRLRRPRRCLYVSGDLDEADRWLDEAAAAGAAARAVVDRSGLAGIPFVHRGRPGPARRADAAQPPPCDARARAGTRGGRG